VLVFKPVGHTAGGADRSTPSNLRDRCCTCTVCQRRRERLRRLGDLALAQCRFPTLFRSRVWPRAFRHTRMHGRPRRPYEPFGRLGGRFRSVRQGRPDSRRINAAEWLRRAVLDAFRRSSFSRHLCGFNTMNSPLWRRPAWGHFQTNRSLHRCPSIGPSALTSRLTTCRPAGSGKLGCVIICADASYFLGTLAGPRRFLVGRYGNRYTLALSDASIRTTIQVDSPLSYPAPEAPPVT
jgi:hypothetical protein